MRVAFILPSLANRGPIIFTQYLLNDLCNFQVDIEVFYFNEIKNNILDLGFKSHKISKFIKYDFSSFDIVHTTMAIPDLYASIFVPKNKWVCSMHNYLIEDVQMSHSFLKSKLITFLWKNSIKKCKNIIVSSQQMALYYKKLLKKRSINYHLISYGIYEKDYTEVIDSDLNVINSFKSRNLKIIGSVGLLIQRKGFSQLLNLVKEHDDLAAIIVGEGNDFENLKKQIDLLGIKDRVYLPGFRNNSHNFYKYFDFYGHVSYSEGFGLAMLEAMSKKLPIICSKLEIYEDYFTDDNVSFFIPGDFSSLNDSYLRILQNKDHYSRKSYELFKNFFDVKNMSKKHFDVYTNICKESHLSN